MKNILSVLLVLLAALLQIASAEPEQKPRSGGTPSVVSAAAGAVAPKKPVEDVIPLTMGNLRGHAMLYNEGWFVVSSSKKALAFAREHALSSSGEALSQALAAAGKDTAQYGRSVKHDVTRSIADGADITVKGTRRTGDIFTGTHELAAKELAYAQENFGRSMDAFVAGTIGIAKRTEEDRRELAAIPGNYYQNLKSDFSNIHDLTDAVRHQFTGKIDIGWDKAFARASESFRAEYERSGESQNTLTALGPVLFGWLKAFYHGVAAPTSKTMVKTTTAGVTYGVFLPVSATAVVAGRTVQSLGLTVYTVGKTGVKIISPTVEGGLLASLSVLSTAAIPVTYAGGAALGAVNQVAFTAAGPAYAAGAAAGTTVLDTAGYVAFVAYDAAAGVTEVVINQAATGIVLGYNALTAIPTHLLLGAGDAAIFLAWDGPRLVIASAKGEVGPKDAGAKVSNLPVGTVVDLKKLKATDGVKVEVLSDDDRVVRDVLERLPDDLRRNEDGSVKAK